MRDWQVAAVTACLVLAHAPARAQSTGKPSAPDRFELTARSETYAELFQRALLPGPNGALVATNTVAPFHQYVFLRSRELSAKRDQALDFELAAWSRAWAGAREAEPLLDGDLQTANVRYRRGPWSVRVGR